MRVRALILCTLLVLALPMAAGAASIQVLPIYDYGPMAIQIQSGNATLLAAGWYRPTYSRLRVEAGLQSTREDEGGAYVSGIVGYERAGDATSIGSAYFLAGPGVGYRLFVKNDLFFDGAAHLLASWRVDAPDAATPFLRPTYRLGIGTRW